MKKTVLTLVALLLAAAVTGPVAAGDWEGKIDGPFMSVETIEVKPYHTGDYMEYLGKGYIPLLAAAKEAGHVLDYGVLTTVTGNAGQGNVVIWWTAPSMDAMQKAGEAMEKMVGEMRPAEEWQAMYEAMAKVREPLSSQIMRAVTWHEMGGGDGDGE